MPSAAPCGRVPHVLRTDRVVPAGPEAHPIPDNCGMQKTAMIRR